MTKYGFNYYLKRAQVLNEMARPSPWTAMGSAGQKLKEIFDYTSKVFEKGGVASDGIEVVGLGGNRHVNKNLRYTIYNILDLDLDDSTSEYETDIGGSDTKSKNQIRLVSCKVLNIPDCNFVKAGYKDEDKLFRAAIKKLIETKADYILSNEFKEKITNKDNILKYSKDNRFKTITSITSAEKRQSQYGIDPDKIDKLQTREGVGDIISKIKKEQRTRKLKYLSAKKKGGEFDPHEKEISGDVNLDNINIIYDALEILINNSNVLKKRIEPILERLYEKRPNISLPDAYKLLDSVIDSMNMKYDKDYIKTLYLNSPKFYESMLNDFQPLRDTGISINSFYKMMDKLKSKNISNKNSLKMIDLIILEVDALKEQIGELTKIEKDGKYDPYSGYDRDIIDKHAPTPELKKIVNDFIEVENNQKRIREENIENRILSREVSAASEVLLMKKKIEEMQKTINKTAKEISTLSQEAYVMDYMTEQVSKDRFKPKGEFKDRGFKKMNYLEWLEKNQ